MFKIECLKSINKLLKSEETQSLIDFDITKQVYEHRKLFINEIKFHCINFVKCRSSKEYGLHKTHSFLMRPVAILCSFPQSGFLYVTCLVDILKTLSTDQGYVII